jgi:hypothetical protein
MTASKALLRSSLMLTLLLGSSVAYAQPGPAQKETARALMAEGRDLRDQGDLQGALTHFSAADSIMGVPTTGFELAATQAQLGKLVEARDTLRRVLAIAPSLDDPPPFNEARAKARALDQQLLARIGTLQFEPSGVDGDALEIKVDGESVPKAALNLPFRVNPGRHQIVARAGDREVKRSVEAAETRTISVALVFQSTASKPAAPSVAAEPATPAPPPPVAEPKRTSSLPMLAYVGGGVAAAGLVVGSIAGISAISHKNAAKKGCVDGSCPPSTWSDLDSARSMATISTVGFVVGAIGFAAGIGAFLLDDKPSHREQAFVVSPDVGPHSARLTVAGRF